MTLWDAFEETVRRGPSAPALVLHDTTVTFAELRHDAERCASWLARRGIVRGDVVALQLPKRRETYALWLACVRQGAPYVFIDPRQPEARTLRVLDRVGARLLVTATPGQFADQVLLEDADSGSRWLGELADDDVPAPAALHSQSPAYVMFTSGSTGEPKGAVIPHGGVLALMRWAERNVGTGMDQRYANLNPLHFDNSVFDLYCGLLSGAALIPVETAGEANPAVWVKSLREGAATVVFAVPTLFLTLARLRLLRPRSLPSVRTFLFGGEGFPIDELRAFHEAFAGHARLINVYGPTETSCICASLEIDGAALAAAGTGLAALGRMHEEFEYAVLDADGAPVARNDVGELWIGGPCVGLGYYAAPEETAARFRQDPRQESYRSVWFRSGDLVREDADRLLWFHGRADNQVKVRGHRIELEEIELVIQSVAGVRRAVCVVVRDGMAAELRAAFACDEDDVTAHVQAACAARLPGYMQPAHLIRVADLPINANGKVDRRAVRAMMESS
ncbi:MAG TPA: amino acid adenylation domain-containing protein [Gemmatimonadaceae bacterium]|nr:amino acid adenylation domain-containing protein [Gemmatimonadaceae bacterium]